MADRRVVETILAYASLPGFDVLSG